MHYYWKTKKNINETEREDKKREELQVKNVKWERRKLKPKKNYGQTRANNVLLILIAIENFIYLEIA